MQLNNEKPSLRESFRESHLLNLRPPEKQQGADLDIKGRSISDHLKEVNAMLSKKLDKKLKKRRKKLRAGEIRSYAKSKAEEMRNKMESSILQQSPNYYETIDDVLEEDMTIINNSVQAYFMEIYRGEVDKDIDLKMFEKVHQMIMRLSEGGQNLTFLESQKIGKEMLQKHLEMKVRDKIDIMLIQGLTVDEVVGNRLYLETYAEIDKRSMEFNARVEARENIMAGLI
jgi:hypothetical protein